MRAAQAKHPIHWTVLPDAEAVAERAAEVVLDTLRQSRRAVLVLPTGRTPEGMYTRLAQHPASTLWRRAHTFNLDEYVGLPADHPGSYASYMARHLFDHVPIAPSRVHLPDGSGADPKALAEACARYEADLARVGPPELAILGLGANGHIAFNEPGTPFDARTHVVQLTEATRAANAPLFEGGEEVPREAITMGIGSILEARRILLLATGPAKAEAVERLRHGPVHESFPASALWRHRHVTALIDKAAWR